MAERIDCVVIGAGVVGLAVARELALSGRETLVLEAHSAIGTQTSSRNSGVIHAGIHYPAESLKARLCVAGKRRLYEFCDSHGVQYRRCGKLIVATDAQQLPALQAIHAAARANDVDDLRWLSGAQARQLEPAISCCATLYSPSTGILDTHGLMVALLGDLECAGGSVALGAAVRRGRCERGGLVLEVATRDGLTTLEAALAINCAGLQAQEVVRGLEGFPPARIPAAYYAKGNYFVLRGTAPFTHLIYPVPEPGGLGVHLTLDLAGQGRFGPDVEWVSSFDYAVNPARAERFYGAIRRYWPQLPDGALHPGYSGIRPKITPPGAPPGDFLIQGPQDHGVPNLINLYGIESPGFTAALAIAAQVAALCATHR